jgi:hypothetical protein
MILSTAAIQSMGFEPIPAGEALEARFHSLHVFELRGLIAPGAEVVTTKARVAGREYELAIGASVNAICQSLLCDDYAEDEGAWVSEHRCASPYAVIHLGPTEVHSVSTGHKKTHSGNIITYDAFPAARAELQELERQLLPSIEMALACTFAEEQHQVQVRFVDRTTWGLTSSGVTVHDLRFAMNATAHVSKPRTVEETRAALGKATALASALNPRVSQFFQLALRDTDALKRFLYHFLAVEIEVHRVFSASSRAQHLAQGLEPNARTASSLIKLLETRDGHWTNLADRFVWCVVSTWVHLTDSDIDEFKRLKKTRDGIAHGEIATVGPDAARAIERLALRIHGPPK